MAKIGRNQPCPCGSGRKYKRCCIHAGTAFESNAVPFEDDIDLLSNRVNHLIKSGQFGPAAAGCRELERLYPDKIDHIHRTAELHEARGQMKEAALWYRRSAAFAREHDGFDADSIAAWEELARYAEAAASGCKTE